MSLDAAEHSIPPDADLRAVTTRLAVLGEVQSAPMFGGLGLTVRGVLVAVWREHRLYVRAEGGDPAAALRPFPGRRLSLGFYSADALPGDWLEHARAAAADIEELATRVPGPPRHRAYRRDR